MSTFHISLTPMVTDALVHFPPKRIRRKGKYDNNMIQIRPRVQNTLCWKVETTPIILVQELLL